jgi:hypothetical protein
MKPTPTCPNCGSPTWLVVVEGSDQAAASHFECFFHIDDNPPDQKPSARPNFRPWPRLSSDQHNPRTARQSPFF